MASESMSPFTAQGQKKEATKQNSLPEKTNQSILQELHTGYCG